MWSIKCTVTAATCVGCTSKVNIRCGNCTGNSGSMLFWFTNVGGIADLPTDVAEEEIMEYFGAYRPAHDGIHILVDDKRKPTGEALILYQTEADTNLAYHKQKVRGAMRLLFVTFPLLS